MKTAMTSHDPEENVYEFSTDDIISLTDRVLLRDDVRYRKEFPSNRHRGLTPMMTGILMINHKARRIAEKRGQRFLGITLYDCQRAFVFCGISNDTIRENTRRLVTMGFLDKVEVKKDRKDKKGTTLYHVNSDKFPCKDGMWFLGEVGMSNGTRSWVINCSEYPFCSCLPKDCVIIENLISIRNLLTDNYLEKKIKGKPIIEPSRTDGFLNGIKKRFKRWIELEEIEDDIKKNFLKIVGKKGDPAGLFDILNKTEKNLAIQKLFASRLAGNMDDRVEEIRKETISLYEKEQSKKKNKS
jgi:hypothetical protein